MTAMHFISNLLNLSIADFTLAFFLKKSQRPGIQQKIVYSQRGINASYVLLCIGSFWLAGASWSFSVVAAALCEACRLYAPHNTEVKDFLVKWMVRPYWGLGAWPEVNRTNLAGHRRISASFGFFFSRHHYRHLRRACGQGEKWRAEAWSRCALITRFKGLRVTGMEGRKTRLRLHSIPARQT